MIQNEVPWANVWCVIDNGQHDATRGASLCGAFIDWWKASIAPLTVPAVALAQARALDIATATGVSVDAPVSPVAPGTNVGIPAGSQVAAMVTLGSGNRGRANRGRKYFPGVPAVDIDTVGGTSLEPASATLYANAVAQLANTLQTIDQSPHLAVESKSQGRAVPVTIIQGRLHLGGQKRRRNNKI